jgi:hypothetical protein
LILLAPASLSAQILAPTGSSTPTWPQWGLNPQHSLFDGGVTGQPLNQILTSFVYDFNVAAEKADPNAANGLDVHYQVPLIDGNDVYVESKDGTYSNSTYSTQKWHQNKYTWQGGKLVPDPPFCTGSLYITLCWPMVFSTIPAKAAPSSRSISQMARS